MGILEELFFSDSEYKFYQANKRAEMAIRTAERRQALHISNPDDAAKFLDEFISQLEAGGSIREHNSKMANVSYIMRYLNAQDNRELFRKYDAYFRSGNVHKKIKESYEKLYREIISVV